MRTKPKHNNLRLTHLDEYGEQTVFYANALNEQRSLSVILGMNIRGTGGRYITDADIDFKVDDTIINADNQTVRITEVPEKRYVAGDNNSRRGAGHVDRVIVTT